MPTDCSPKLFGFEGVERKAVVAGFDGGAITSNAGALLLGQVDRGLGLVRRFAACFTDRRDPRFVEHRVETLVGQRLMPKPGRVRDGLSLSEPSLQLRLTRPHGPAGSSKRLPAQITAPAHTQNHQSSPLLSLGAPTIAQIPPPAAAIPPTSQNSGLHPNKTGGV